MALGELHNEGDLKRWIETWFTNTAGVLKIHGIEDLEDQLAAKQGVLPYVSITDNAEPDDADIEDSECRIWFDDDNAGPNLMLKGKDSDGVVWTQVIPLV